VLSFYGENASTIPDYEDLTPLPDLYLRPNLDYCYFDTNRLSQHLFGVAKVSNMWPQTRHSAHPYFVAEPGMSGSGVFDNRGYFVEVLEAVSQNFDVPIFSIAPPYDENIRKNLKLEIYDKEIFSEMITLEEDTE
jgi:hypothetical protein